MTAYQNGCEALVALGQADATEYGATPRDAPQLPDILPRWDDICVAVLRLAAQRNLLSYRRPDGTIPPPRLMTGGLISWQIDAPPPPAPNIAAVQGLGAAYATAEVRSLLQLLGLIFEGCWTKRAEIVFWRVQPIEWDMNIGHDSRFAEAVVRAFDTMPGDIGVEVDRLATITEADVKAAVRLSVASYEQWRVKFGPNARISPPHTADQARRRLEFVRRGALDWLFFRRWRFTDGWLMPTQAERALEIFHDPLAIAMRRAVIIRLYPDRHFLADMPQSGECRS